MSKENMENKFSADLDRYLSSNEICYESETEETAELLKLGKALAGMDFSRSSDKEAVRRRVQKNMNSAKGNISMRKPDRIKRFAVAAASLVVVCAMSISFMQTAFAQELYVKILNSISLGHITVLQMEPSKTNESPAPAEPEHKTNSEITTKAQKEKEQTDSLFITKNIDELNKYTCFNVILPDYLPEGYKFNRAEFYKDEKGNISPKYIGLFFTNENAGKQFYMQQRFADDETALTAGTEGAIEQIKINGSDAVLYDNANVHWEANNVLYLLLGRDLDKTELIAIAESIK